MKYEISKAEIKKEIVLLAVDALAGKDIDYQDEILNHLQSLLDEL